MKTFIDPPNWVGQRYRAKVVPDDRRDDDGRWIGLPVDIDVGQTWAEHVGAIAPYLPEGTHLVAVDQFYYDNTPIRVGNQAGYEP